MEDVSRTEMIMLTVFVYTTPYEMPSHTTMMGDCGEGFDDRVCLTHGIYNFYVAVDSKGLLGLRKKYA